MEPEPCFRLPSQTADAVRFISISFDFPWTYYRSAVSRLGVDAQRRTSDVGHRFDRQRFVRKLERAQVGAVFLAKAVAVRQFAGCCVIPHIIGQKHLRAVWVLLVEGRIRLKLAV